MSGTVKRAKLTRKDIALWDGRTKEYSRIDASGGTVDGLTIDDHVDVLQVFGAGTARTRITIADAIRFITTSNTCTLLFSTGTWTIDDNLTIPANFTCRIPAGCVFSISSGKTLTFSGAIYAESASFYIGSGTIALSADSIVAGQQWFKRTPAEDAASVTPATFSVPPIDEAQGAARYSSLTNARSVIVQTESKVRTRVISADDYITNTTPGTTNVLSDVQSLYDDLPTKSTLVFGPNTYYLGNSTGLVLDDQKHILCYDPLFTYDGSGIAIQLGAASVQKYIRMTGAWQIQRTASISHAGTQTAASQLLGTGLKVVNLADGFLIEGRANISGFAQGLYVEGNAAGCTNGKIGNIGLQDNLIDLYLKNDASANSFITSLIFEKLTCTFNTAFYSSIVGTRCYESSLNGHTIDGNIFQGCQMEALKERKILEDGSFQTHIAPYLDVSNGGTDIELSANSREVIFIGSSDMRLQAITDSGNSNSFQDPRYIQFKSGHTATSGEVWYTYNGSNDIPARIKTIGITLADDDIYNLPDSASGLVAVSCGNEGGLWHVTSAAVCTKLAGTTNTDNADTDTKLCVYDGGTVARVRNRLGSSLKTVIEFIHWV